VSPFPYYHDEEGSFGTVGKSAFYESEYDIAELKVAVAKLGAPFAAVRVVKKQE
jgi:hypothetical protein